MTTTWYSDAAKYWDAVPSTVDGMLGGFGTLTELDCATSLRFLNDFATENAKKGTPLGKSLACDCGAGIGRVSKGYLLKFFDQVDLVEQNPKFLEEAERSFLADLPGRVQRFVPLGLQSFNPEEGRYDVIWCQWVLGHLTDDDLVAFFKRCKKGLKPNGAIGVKENLSSGATEVDKEDSSVTRPETLLKEIFQRAGLKIVREIVQQGFPKALYQVKMFMLQ
ncbi:hypothetical protein HDU76_000990 [Blyttiomyces sp. JEL0837]|nr:hypothetical protein HDU76_000990 [Blyttiomyces sp. JEL0837]